MSDSPAVEGLAPLSQVERVVDTFVAPSKTFTDILRSASWWLPFLLTVLFSIGWGLSIDKTIGFRAASEQQISMNPKAEEQMAQLTPAQREQRMSLTATITRYSTYGSFVFVLIIMLMEALVLWGSFNFILGASTTFGRTLAVCMYASLPRIFIFAISSIFLFTGVGTETFDMRNPVGTNLGFYVHDPGWMKTGGAFFDIFGFWSLALLVIGMAIISHKKIAASAGVVLGWWALILLISTVSAGIFS
jgi:hypothetical protein